MIQTLPQRLWRGGWGEGEGEGRGMGRGRRGWGEGEGGGEGPKGIYSPKYACFLSTSKTYKMLYEWIQLAFHAIFAKVHQGHFNRG